MKILVKEILTSSNPLDCPIDSEQKLTPFEVVTLLDGQEYRFNLDVESDLVGEKELQSIRTDRAFNDIFRYNLRIHRDICRLVFSYYNHQPIQLPVDLGELQIEPPVSINF